MERKEEDARWFLIRHEQCGSMITIKSKKFVESHKLHNKSSDNLPYLACPSSIGTTIKGETDTKLHRFLSNYHEPIKGFASKGFSIREIEEEIKPESDRIQS